MPQDRNPASRILRNRAMAILRKTREGIDPQLLSAMKEHLSAAMPQARGLPPSQSQPKRETVFQNEKPISPPSPAPLEASPDMEPVDRQKIAQIVMQYMKNRDDKSKH